MSSSSVLSGYLLGLSLLPFLTGNVLDATPVAAPIRPLVFGRGARAGEYLSQGASGSLRLTRAGIEFSCKDQPLVRLSLAGAQDVEPVATNLQPSVANYFLGNDSTKWRTGVANYARVRYSGVYPGIDLVVYGSEGSFEYDFAVAPHADPSRIRMRFDGAKKVRLNAAGDLLIDGGLTQRHPRVFQQGRQIAGNFRIHTDRSVTFDLDAYDPALPLTIDPVITYVSYLGGNSGELPLGLTVDKTGNVYVSGYTYSSDFPGNGVFGQRPIAHQFAFVSKFAPIAGGKTQLLYTIFFGDNASLGFAMAFAVAVDSSGNVIVAGRTNVPGFPTQNAFQSKLAGGSDCGDKTPTFCGDGFLTKFAPDGRTLIFSTYYGGTLENYFSDVTVDVTGGIYALGEAAGPTDLAGTPNSFQPMPVGGDRDMLVVRFDPAGKLLYSTYLGGPGRDTGSSIAVEKPGVVWIGGNTGSKNMPMPAVNNGLLTRFAGNDVNGYFARVDMNQSGAAALTYASYFTGSFGNTRLFKLFIDPTGQIGFCGSTIADIPVTATRMQNFGGAPASRVTSSDFSAGDGYVARINPALAGINGLSYSTFVGGRESDLASSCGMDAAGNLVVTGTTYGLDVFLIGGSPIPYKFSTGEATSKFSSIFLIRIDPTRAGGRIDSFLFGGTAAEQAGAMSIDAQGFAYVVGQTSSQQFPTTPNAVQKTYGGDEPELLEQQGVGDAFLLQADLNAIQTPVAGLIQESGDFQLAAPGSVVSAPISVHLADAQGNPLNLSGYPISFTSSSAQVSSPQSITDGGGVAGVNVRMNGGDATIVASTGFAGFKDYTFHIKAVSGALPRSVAIVSGDKQSGRAGGILSEPLLVELRDANNSPLALGGVTIQFKPTNATVSAATAVTDGTGRASTTITLGAQAAPPTVQVVVGGLPAVTATFSIASPPAISAGGIVSAASFKGGAVSPGLIATLFGVNIGPSILAKNVVGSDGKFSTSLANTRVLFDGIPAAMIYASAGQTSVIVPYEVAGKASTLVTVEYQGVVSSAQSIAVAPAQLGLFSANATGSGQGAILNQDNSVNSSTNPAGRNGIVILFGTGEGQTDPPGINGQIAATVYPKPKTPITVKINGIPAEVLYYGAAPTLVAGVLQVNVRIPADVPDGNATVEVFEGASQSPPTITVAVKGQQ